MSRACQGDGSLVIVKGDGSLDTPPQKRDSLPSTKRSSVADNGVGIDKDVLEDMNAKLGINEVFSERKIGLANLNNRLKLSYGPDARLTLYSKKEHYTKVVILIPKGEEQ